MPSYIQRPDYADHPLGNLKQITIMGYHCLLSIFLLIEKPLKHEGDTGEGNLLSVLLRVAKKENTFL